MELHDRIYVNASVLAVWSVLGEPALMELWNPTCVRCHVGHGPLGLGFTYKATFKLSRDPEQDAECMIEEYQPNELLTTKYSGSAFRRNGFVRETYRLIPKRHGTQIKQTVDFAYSELPITIHYIMKFINVVGYSAGKEPLDGIKELAEQEESQRAKE